MKVFEGKYPLWKFKPGNKKAMKVFDKKKRIS